MEKRDMTAQQTTLDGGVSNRKTEPWKGVCCNSCYNAEHDRCTCRCGGRYHGLGNSKKRDAEKSSGKAESISAKPFPSFDGSNSPFSKAGNVLSPRLNPTKGDLK